MSGGWGCPHELEGRCQKVDQRPCDPGMKGCVLAGRYVFFNDDKNTRRREKSARQTGGASPADAPPTDDSAGEPH